MWREDSGSYNLSGKGWGGVWVRCAPEGSGERKMVGALGRWRQSG